MNTYDIKLNGSIDRLGVFLSDLLEKQITPLNKNYKFKLEDLNWATLADGSSQSEGRYTFDSALRSKDIKDIENNYKIKLTSKKVTNETVSTS